jgi:2-polyprenyl-3-methyl-5-hydroxy-6-metoxy-1,4-benzoquinol methylase
MADAAAQPGPVARGGIVRRVGRIVLWPIRRFFDPRFGGLAAAQHATLDQVAAGRAEAADRYWSTIERFDSTDGQLNDLYRLAEADMDASTEAAAVIGAALAELRDETTVLSRLYLARSQEGGIEDLDERGAAFLNYAGSHRGFAAQAGLWLNPAVLLEYGTSAVRLAGTNERIVEVPYALRALGAAPAGTRILDVGSAESTLAFSLACLGYDVTAVDPRGYPFEHPRLRVLAGGVEDLDEGGDFDAVVCLSTIEHIGVEAYGQDAADRADLEAMRRLGEVTKPGGLLVLTTPFGRPETTDSERRYDRAGLDTLLEGWEIQDLVYARRLDASDWTVENEAEDDGEQRVALVTARRPG